MKFVEALPTTPARFGLLDAAVVVDDPDPHAGFGVTFQPNCGIAHSTLGACVDPEVESGGGRDLGEATVSVSVDEQATLDTPFGEAGSYTVVWGDGSLDSTVVADDGTDLDAITHVYPGIVGPDQVYTLHVHGPSGYHVHIEVTVSGTPATPSGPFVGDATDTGGVSEFPTEKQISDGVPVVEAEPFAVYHLFQCRAPGGITEAGNRARTSFQLAEGRAVEEHFAEWLTREAMAVDLTPTVNAMQIVDGLAALELYAGQNYGGTPVMHMDRASALVLLQSGAVQQVSGRLETMLGSRVVAGGGYVLGNPDGATPTAVDETWLYVTGTVGVWRGEVLSTDALLLGQPQLVAAVNSPSSTPAPPVSGYRLNDFRVLVERPYTVATECITGAVRVTRTTCCFATEVPPT